MVNHTCRAQTEVERRYSQIEGESLAIQYGVVSNRMFLIGIQFTVVTDHKPLVPLYNDPKRPGPMRVDRHRLGLLAYDFVVTHEPGKLNPCDYGSRHPIPLDKYTARELDKLALTDDVEIHVNLIVGDSLPEAVTWEIMAKASNADPTLRKLKGAIHEGILPDTPELKPYRHIFTELTTARSLVLYGCLLYTSDAADE